jgi:hypothetical protein
MSRLTFALPVVAGRILAMVALLLSLAASLRWPWLAITCLALVLVAVATPPRLGTELPAQVLLAAGAIVQWTHSGPAGWPPVAAGGALLGLLLVEDLLHRAARPVHQAVNLPGSPRGVSRLTENGTGRLVNSGAVVLLGLLAVVGWPAWTALVPAAGAALLSAVLLADAWHRRQTGHRAELAGLRRAIARHQPAFLLYFSAPAGSEYQATMWLPYLERIGQPFAVVLAEPDHLRPISRATRAPTVVHRTVAALEAAIPPSVRAVFYVNNGMRNAHCVRFTQLTHVQLYHGYSDKPVSVNPIATIFDRMFVPGQAIVDQFLASGAGIPPERFRIVGRPQVADLTIAARHVSQISDQVVLYAPTWAGEYADSNHCSLPIAEQIIQQLLDRGATVIVRPHPYTKRDPRSLRQLRRAERMLAADQRRTGRPHRWGRAASTQLTVAECMNRSDAMICDVSSVATQYLYTHKPLAITDMVSDDAGFARTLPLARGAYLIGRTAADLPAVLDDLLARDPLAAERLELRRYYLGDFPADRYLDGFLVAARLCLSGADGGSSADGVSGADRAGGSAGAAHRRSPAAPAAPVAQ